MGPVICFVTGGDSDLDGLVERIGAAARAGIHLIQVREPRVDDRTLIALIRRSVAAARGTPARIVVNDRLDVALASGAHGVHLRADSLAAGRVRALAPRPFLVGRSVHDVPEAASATAGGGLDYLVFGTVFPSASKPGRPVAGLESLAAAVRATPLPVLAIGGITLPRLSAVAGTGAAGFAAISLFTGAPRAGLSDLAAQARFAFAADRRG